MRRTRLGALLLAGVVALTGGVAQSAPASAATTSVLVMSAGQKRAVDSWVPNGDYSFVVKPGSFSVDQQGTLNGPRQIVTSRSCWEVNTPHPSTNSSYVGLTNAGDFQLVVPGAGVVWHSNTAGRGGKYLMLTRTGDLVLYTANWKILWQSASGQCWMKSNTVLASNHSIRVGYTFSGTRPWRVLAMQTNGNLVLRHGSKVVWQTRTNVPGSRAALTTLGELLVQAPNGKVLWRSNRRSSPNCACALDLGFPALAELAITNVSTGPSITVWQVPVPPA